MMGAISRKKEIGDDFFGVNEISEILRDSTDQRHQDFYRELAKEENSDKDIKNIAISCGINLLDLSNLFKRGAMAKAMYQSSMTIASKMNAVVENVLDASMSGEATDKDRRLALELCGIIEKGGSKSSINVNIGGDGRSQEHQAPPRLFEENVKASTILVNAIPEEK